MKYEVFYIRTGYAEIEASSPEEAVAKADRFNEEISWSDDWKTDTVQEAESLKCVYDGDRGFINE